MLVRRLGTVLWKQSRPAGGRFVVQVGQDSLDHRWVFSAIAPGIALPPTSLWSNAGDDLDLPGTALAGLNIDPDAAQLNTRLRRCIQVIDAWRSAGVLSSQLSPVG